MPVDKEASDVPFRLPTTVALCVPVTSPSRLPEKLTAVPVVSWLSVGKSAATAIEGTPVEVVFLRIPVERPDSAVPFILVTVDVSTPVDPEAVTSPEIEMVWSPVLVPEIAASFVRSVARKALLVVPSVSVSAD